MEEDPVEAPDQKNEEQQEPLTGGRAKLHSWLNKSMRVRMTDGRTLVGTFTHTHTSHTYTRTHINGFFQVVASVEANHAACSRGAASLKASCQRAQTKQPAPRFLHWNASFTCRSVCVHGQGPQRDPGIVPRVSQASRSVN